MTEAERRLCDGKCKRSGSFFTALFELMARADAENLAKLSLGFPDEGEAIQRYLTLDEYWPNLEREYNVGHADMDEEEECAAEDLLAMIDDPALEKEREQLRKDVLELAERESKEAAG